MTGERLVWRCQCPEQCEDGESCWSDVSQEDFLCDWCRQFCMARREITADQGALL